MECKHQWVSDRSEDEYGTEVTVLTCSKCGHLWLIDFDEHPPVVRALP